MTSAHNPLLSVPNPFHGVVVQDVWQRLTFDVASIHQSTFDLCLAALNSVSRGQSDSVLIYGSPGSGKTHLISRLQQHLFATSKDAPDKVLRCVFVAVRLQSSPTQLWQHVRQRLAADLLRKEEGLTQLQRLIAHQIAIERGEHPRTWVRNLRVLTGTGDGVVSQYLQGIAEKLDLGRDLFVVLDHLLQGRLTFDATAWLKGDGLQDLVLERLGVSRDEGEEREDAARKIVTSLCRLAGETLPIVFCFDQVESLQRFSKDSDALFRFGRMAADLADADDNVLIISCLQSAFIEQLQSAVAEPDRDRAFKRRSALEPLSREQIQMLVLERLERVAELQPLRAANAHNPLYPLDSAFLDDLYRRTPRTPRKIIASAADRFELLRTGIAPAAPNLPAFIENSFRVRRREALERLRPEDAQQTLLHGLPLLWATLRADAKPTSLSELQDSGADLLLRNGRGDTRIIVCNDQSMNGLAARFRRLVGRSDPAPNGAAPVLVRDSRLKISSTAKRTREYLDELRRRGYGFLQPALEELAALEALRSLVSDARSGDLSVSGETVSQGEVQRWLFENVDEGLARLLEALESGARAADDAEAELEQDLLELVLDEHVVSLEAAAGKLHTSLERVRLLVERKPDRYSLLQGPPALLFAHVPDEALPDTKEGS